MSRSLRVAVAQSPPHPLGADLGEFAAQVREHALGGARLVVYPELHLFGADAYPEPDRNAALDAAAVPLDGQLVRDLAVIARDAGVWLVPGSICERGPGGELFNTALVLSPRGEVSATYRKVFPWRPSEPYAPGDRFVVADVDGVRIGLDICYDAWFPEVTRHLAWMGAEVVLNVVKTTTADRPHELVLARANAIVNQVFMVSVNCAGPVGRGRSIVVDPEGEVLAEAPGDEATTLDVELDLDHVDRVRTHGTAGVNRMWAQFRADDAPLALPLYGGRIDPATWEPRAAVPASTASTHPAAELSTNH
ncbi:Predicted amidohydrolase [Quadrisphaera granulorum]|uniref:Putative amidohydrolase n=1 Tax=Quadrisphaera granulorum TaxID=317664 RepID=A0A316A6B9_9ACTN|nr:carbon-nitrogen hydrolase family protein [Quadrisphaera granulorum]PWJ53059.1 putative amidohydrolase [Quadrisphaera granulorum]SZE97224.1 Predicted amidohydrolase [Quadrisphaera granulorum]